MKFWTKLFSRCGIFFLIAFPISVNSQIVPSLNAHQEAELGTEIAQGVDSTPRSADFRTSPFYFGCESSFASN
jgi:hypothetical protein